jgi:hypothetical protein
MFGSMRRLLSSKSLSPILDYTGVTLNFTYVFLIVVR